MTVAVLRMRRRAQVLTVKGGRKVGHDVCYDVTALDSQKVSFRPEKEVYLCFVPCQLHDEAPPTRDFRKILTPPRPWRGSSGPLLAAGGLVPSTS